MPPNRATLNQPVNLNSANALYNHAVSTGAVHGLPTGANVLGDKNGTGRFISTVIGSVMMGYQNSSCDLGLGIPVSYAIAYSSQPACFVDGGCMGSHWTMQDAHTTGVTVMHFGYYSWGGSNCPMFIFTVGV